MTWTSKHTIKKVLRAIGKRRRNILKEALRTVKALFRQMQPLFDNKTDEKRSIYISKGKKDAESPTCFDEEIILQAKKLLTEIKNGYNYWQDPNKFFEVLNSEAETYNLFSKYDEFSQLQELMNTYEMTGINLSFYLNQIN